MQPLITPDQLALYPGAKKLSDASAQFMCEVVSGVIRDYCGWHIAPSVTTDGTGENPPPLVADGSGTWIQDLPTLHLTAVIEITNDGSTVDPVEWSERGQMIRPCRTCWTEKFRGVTAAITHGYEKTPAAILGVALGALSRAVAATPGTQSRTVGGISVTYATGQRATVGTPELSRGEMFALGRYRLPGRPG